MNPFKRHVLVGMITDTHPKTRVEVTIHWNGKRLSISGYTWRRLDWDVDSAGQIVDQLSEVDRLFIPAADRDELVEVWNRWHLNDMRAGCEHQRAWGWGEERLPDGKWSGHVYPSEHPGGVLGLACAICGYEYGTKWLHEDVPEDVLEFLAHVGDSVTERAPS